MVLGDGQGAQSHFEFPCSVAADGDGNIIISDSENPRIRKIAAEGAEEEDAADVPDVVDPDSDDDENVKVNNQNQS